MFKGSVPAPFSRFVMIPLPLLTTTVAMGYFSLSFCLSAHMARFSGLRW
jgi:hypothetical protein